MQELKRFPIGVQDFERLRNDGKYYVDKTDLVYKMTHTDDYYFFFCLRRFGKSLLVSTLKCYFEGRKDLFTGLAIERLEKEWKKYPVLHISFAINKYITLKDLDDTMQDILSIWEKEYDLEITKDNAYGTRFSKIIRAAYSKTGMQPVVLVDEYDAPLLDSMENPELQNSLKQEMRKFFSPLKDLGGIIRFVFLTGISKFSQLSIFSELNNLKVITMNDDYGGICGITEEELFSQMKPEIQALADKQNLSYGQACEALKAQYDGYHFSAESPDVYNPFSLINALSDKSLANYWFSTGTPTILTKLISKYEMDPKDFDEGFEATQEMFDAPTETATDAIPMLYQSGYLTIKGYENGTYTLQFPNNEVRFGFLKSLMPYYATPLVSKNDTFLLKFTKALRNEDLEQALTLTKAFISSVPYNAEKQTEAHYKTIFYLIARLCTPYVVRTEEASAAGRSDMVIETKTAVYMFELKLDGSAEDALKQITEKGYLIQYTAKTMDDGSAKKLYKIGISFDTKTRTIGEWKVE